MKLISAKRSSLFNLIFCVLMILAAASASQAQSLAKVAVTGVVADDTGAAIPGVTVSATRIGEPGSSIVEVTDGEGKFRLANLKPGVYSIEAVLDGFATVSRDITLVTGQTLDLAFKLVPAFAEALEVVAQADPTGEVAILESRRQAPVVSDSISAEEIRKTPDSSAAGVVERLTGVTLLGDKYVFVRGLGERYSGTTINGATLPTTETEKRVVPLDLFPAKLLETVNVIKTYTPDKPGDFGSGVVEMTTTQFPAGSMFKLTIGTGFHSEATGERFRRYAGGLNMAGDGGQRLSSVIPRTFVKRRSIFDPSGFTAQELEQFGEAMIGDWTGDEFSAPANTDLSLTYGNTFGRLGVVLSVVSNHNFDFVEEEQRFFGLDVGDVLVAFNDYDLVMNREHANAGLVGNLSYRLNDNHRLSLNSVFTRDASAEDRVQQGLQTSSGGVIRDFRVRHQIEEMFSSRLKGEHTLPGPGISSLLEWTFAQSNASNDSDLRENLYRESDPGVFTLATGYPESGKSEYFNLADEIVQGGVSYSVFFSPNSGNWSGLIRAGADVNERTRDFGARRFRFVTATPPQMDLSRTPEEIFTSANIGPGLFELAEVTGVNDAYDADHTIDAVYLMADSTFGRWRVIGGARYERSDQRVATFNPFDSSNAVNAINQSNDLLPSLNLVYELAAKTNLRFAYGRSVNRPEFRELSPFAFVEVAGGRSVAGNPDLEQATIDGLDLRWETFPTGGEVVAASAFFKRIGQPIERIVQPTSDFRTSFVNADHADLWGVELEFRRSLAAVAPALSLWSVNVNYAWIHSQVTLGEHQFSVLTNSERPLEGQSDQVVNVALQFYQPRWGSMMRLLGSHTGERLTEVGAFGLPDIYESANTSFDLVYSQALAFLNKGLELKIAGTNLLGDERQFTQGGEIQRLFAPGRKISLSLSYSPN